MLDQVTGMRIFVRVAAAGSLAATGRALSLSQTMVTKHVDAIEARLGVRLLHRSTRRLTLTEAGRGYLQACQRILLDIDEAEQAAGAGQAEPRGVLRMNVPVSFGTVQIAPLLGEFRTENPLVELDIGLDDRVVDLVEEGWDLAVRIGILDDSTLTSRRLAPCRTVVCASPAYLEAHGTPRTTGDLGGHNCLGYTLSDRLGADRWTFGTNGSVTAPISGSLRANNGDALRAAALAGLGVIYQPTFLVADDLHAGRLVALPLDHPPTEAAQIHAVFRPDRRMPLKSRAMIEFLAGRFGDQPPWDHRCAYSAGSHPGIPGSSAVLVQRDRTWRGQVPDGAGTIEV